MPFGTPGTEIGVLTSVQVTALSARAGADTAVSTKNAEAMVVKDLDNICRAS
ncbi:hypothetical protein [Actinomadura sp. DC4]|uniref:hypothetical protein n=1 Tax=Actinomadura sp. DC4 TaxID=3055069 RepID=UPI0025B15EB2|nr:hypothetical protein [Actinomadura sp. DC4]MDN3359685.1 hypothetical protein [Actinomadura sp. DC4]